MRKYGFKLLGITVALLSINSPAHGCNPRSNSFYGEMLPNGGCGIFAEYTNFTLGSYFRMPVLEGANYTFSTCGATYDTQITGFQGTNTTTEIFYNDDNGPVCSGLNASIVYTSTFTDYTRVMINEYNCQPLDEANPSEISVYVWQNNNLSITSSLTDMCEGEMRNLTATPAAVTGAQLNSGDSGTFSGTGVSGTTFTAPTPGGSSQNYTINYAFGYCGVSRDITVHANPTAAAAGDDQTDVCGLSTTLQGNSPTIGTGSWTTVLGPGSAASPTDPNSAVNGLVKGVPTTLQWQITNGACSPSSDQVVLTVDDEPPVPSLPSLSEVTGCFSVTPPTPTANDNCSGVIDGKPDAVFPITSEATTSVTWYYEDAVGNISTQSQYVTVNDVDVDVTLTGQTLTANASPATYQWLECSTGLPIAGATKQSFTPQESGRFSVEVTQNGCTAASGCVSVEIFPWPMFMPAIEVGGKE